MKICNWGRYPCVDAEVKTVRSEDELREQLYLLSSFIPRGAGRCYGDSALAPNIVDFSRMDKLLSFDAKTGKLTVEAGVTLAELVELFLPRGWFLPVTPGTKFVTVGGAIASDVHGKNHHMAGSFSRQLHWLDLLTPDGQVQRCSRTRNRELYWATCGGMGLTGAILRASFSLQPVSSIYIKQRLTRAENLEEVMQAFRDAADQPYSVAWIDCLATGDKLGRSLLMAGDHLAAEAEELSDAAHPLVLPRQKNISIPVDFPNFALNRWSVKLFNELYFRKAPRGSSASVVDYHSFFYPLDAIGNWNRIYGKRGFTQYQFVLPEGASAEGLRVILERIAASGQGSFLAVLKLFGEQEGLLSFPLRGYTLALDFAIVPALFPLLDELDRIVLDYGGRLYLTKDVRMSKETFDAGYGAAAERFRELRAQLDPERKLSSLQAERIGL